MPFVEGYDASAASEALAVGRGMHSEGQEVASTISLNHRLLRIISFSNHIFLADNMDFAARRWPAWKRNIAWLHARIDLSTGLLSYQASSERF